MGYSIKNKKESFELIEQLGLNKFASIAMEQYDETKLWEFLAAYPNIKRFSIRDLAKADSEWSRNFRDISKEQMIKESRQRSNIMIQERSEYDNKRVLCGEIALNMYYPDIELILTATDNPNAIIPMARLNPTYNFRGSFLNDKRLKHLTARIKGFNEIVDYMFKHELFDVIIEFSVHEKPVGVKRECVRIGELRTDY